MFDEHPSTPPPLSEEEDARQRALLVEIRRQYELLEPVLDDLIKSHRCKWAVCVDGRPLKITDTEEGAFGAWREARDAHENPPIVVHLVDEPPLRV